MRVVPGPQHVLLASETLDQAEAYRVAGVDPPGLSRQERPRAVAQP
jgi:hypothetical protein